MINSLIVLADAGNKISTPWWVYMLFALGGGLAMALSRENAKYKKRKEYEDDDDGGDDDEDEYYSRSHRDYRRYPRRRKTVRRPIRAVLLLILLAFAALFLVALIQNSLLKT